MLLGAHESIAGGLARAFARAQEDGAQAVQIFTKSARGWKAKPLLEDDCRLFRAEGARLGIPAVAHAAYLVNLAAEGPMRDKSLASFADELSRCEQLGIRWLIVHPGAHPELARGILLVAEALDQALASLGRAQVGVALEVTAGQGGTSIGWQLEHLAEIFGRARRASRLGVCLDTCHLYAAGYDIATERGLEQTLARCDELLGLARVQAFHLNDCKKPLGSRVDRHEEIGQGTLGLKAFAPLLNDPRFARVPAVLETPEPANFKENLRKLRGLLRDAGSPG